MSIANLINSVLPAINAIIGNFNDVFTRAIDANNQYGSTLFVGSNSQTVNLQLGAVSGIPVTIPPGILCSQVNSGGTLGVGPVLIGNQTETTSVIIGNLTNNTAVLGQLALPSSTITPLVITQSAAQFSATTDCNGAIVSQNIGTCVLYKIQNIVTFTFLSTMPLTTDADMADSIHFTFQIPSAYLPAATMNFPIMVYINNVYTPGRCLITNGGLIAVGEMDTLLFTNGQTAAVLTFSINYPSP